MVGINRILGIVPVLGGIYGTLIAYRIIPMNRKEPEKEDLWHKRFGTMMKILSPLVILFGILAILGIL
ncbi:MAG: hypothetical protein ACYSWZ_05360 [Planctomycetota bacterium]|jgi:hypothetical protein